MAISVPLNQGQYFGKDETVTKVLDGTEYAFELDVSENEYWIGNKTIQFTGEGTGSQYLTFVNDVEGQLGYSTDGDDLVINIFGIVKDYFGSHVDTSKIIGTVRITNGATDFFDDAQDRLLVLDSDNNFGDNTTDFSYFYVGNKNATEKQILKGSYLSEKFYCGKGNDEIYTGIGGGDDEYNEVHINTGNAVITLDKDGVLDENVYLEDTFKDYNGDDSYWVPQEAVFSKGGSTLIGATGKNGEHVGDTVILASSHPSFYRKGNDLCIFDFIVRDYQYYSGKNSGLAYEARLNIKDYFVANSKVEIDGYTSEEDKAMLANIPIMLKEGKGTLKGTFDPEAIVAKAKSTIYTKGGYDNIYLSTGNDTVIVDGNGYKTIYASGATGHNTVIVKNKNADIDIEYLGINPFRNNIGNPKFDKKGNDLVIKPGYGYNYASSGYETSSVTIKDYFKNYHDINLLGGDIEDFLDEYTFTINGNTKKKNTLYGTNYDDTITGGNKKDVIYTGDGDDTIYTTAGNDKIVINGTGTKLIYLKDGDVTVDRKDSTAIVDIHYWQTYGEPFSFYQKKGKDLVVTVYKTDGAKYIKHTATIKNAYDSDGTLKDGLRYNGSEIKGSMLSYDSYVSGKGKITLPAGSTYTTVMGSGKNDTINTAPNVNRNIIFAGKGNDKIYTGNGSNVIHGEAGNDTINIVGNSNTIYAGTGNDTININSSDAQSNMFFADGDGKDTININTETLADPQNIQFKTGTNYNNNYSYSQIGDNLVITKNYKDSKGKVKNDTITIKDYFAESKHDNLLGKICINTIDYEHPNYIETYGNSGDIYAKGLIIKGTYNKKAKATYFYSTKFKDIINGTNKKDVITMEEDYFDSSHSEYEVVAPGKGDDTIYLTAQNNSFYLNLADGDGKDTLIFDNLFISNPSYTKVHLQYLGKGAQGSVRKGDDLVIHNIYEDTKGNIKSDSLIVKEFFDSYKKSSIDEMMENNEYFSREYAAYSSNKKNNITINENVLATTGAKDDTVIVNSNATVFTGKGNDKITLYGDADIYAGKGNDTITLSGYDQSVCLNFNKGDGNDTVIANGNYDYLSFVINDILPDSLDNAPSALSYVQSALDDGKMGFKTNGNDLIFYRQNGKKQDTITMKDTVKYGSGSFDFNSTDVIFTGKNITFACGMDDLIDYWTGYERGIETIGSYNKKTKTTSYEGAYTLSSEFNFSGKGKATMKGGEVDDIYNVTFSKKTNLLINDSANKGAYGDLLDVSAKAKDISIFFDVQSNGSIGTGETGLLMFQKGCMNNNSIHWQMNDATGRIVISDYFGSSDYFPKYGNTDMRVGGGKIEYIEIGDNNIATEDWISSVAFEVAQWLNQNDCTSAMYTLNNGTKDQINSLLAIYQGHTADMYTNMQM